MAGQSMAEAADIIRNNLRLKTFPVAVKFLKDQKDFPEKTRRPSVALGKRVAICQAVTMARIYGWTVGLTKEDIVCVPAAIAFGFSDSADSGASWEGSSAREAIRKARTSGGRRPPRSGGWKRANTRPS